MTADLRLQCVRYEITQRRFRRLLGEEWGPTFISKFGNVAKQLYTQLYSSHPNRIKASNDDDDTVNLYPYGILVQAYRQLIEAGEKIGEPYRPPDPTLERTEPARPEGKYVGVDGKRHLTETARWFADFYKRGGPLEKHMLKRLAEKASAKSAGHEPDNSHDDDLWESPWDD